MLSELEIREAFHCIWLANVAPLYRAPSTSSAPLRLKGGVNLRLFHGSPRYSEDIDLDLSPERGPKFIDQMRKLLTQAPPFRRALLAVGITDMILSEIDNGDRGFKQKLRLVSGGVEYHTKIEVSYREETSASEAVIQQMPATLAQRYKLQSGIEIAAYTGPTAIWQKTLALSRRMHPQTRDVFDLQHVRQQLQTQDVATAESLISERMNSDQVAAAANTVLSFTTDQFRDQTAAFLPSEKRADAIASWPKTQEEVWEWLEDRRAEITRSEQESQDASKEKR